MNRKLAAALLIATEGVLFFAVVLSGEYPFYFEFFVAACAFLYSLMNARKDPFLCLALLFTVVSDVFLILVRPTMQGVAMTTFLLAQTMHAVRLSHMAPTVKHQSSAWVIRAAVCVVAVGVTVYVLRSGTDYVSVISILYFANLLVNLAVALSIGKRSVLTAVGQLLFVGCDVFIGLRCAAGVYLDILPGSTLYSLVFADFNFAYFFYIPSQTILALSVSDATRCGANCVERFGAKKSLQN